MMRAARRATWRGPTTALGDSRVRRARENRRVLMGLTPKAPRAQPNMANLFAIFWHKAQKNVNKFNRFRRRSAGRFVQLTSSIYFNLAILLDN
jgi:hypothetical protein